MTTEVRRTLKRTAVDADRCHAGNEPVRDRCLGGIRAALRRPASHGSGPGFILEPRSANRKPDWPGRTAGLLELRPGHRREDRRLLTWSRAGGPRDSLERRRVSVVGSIRTVLCGRQRQEIGGRMMLLNRASCGRGRGRPCARRRRRRSCRTGHSHSLVDARRGSAESSGDHSELTSTVGRLSSGSAGWRNRVSCTHRHGSHPGLGSVSEIYLWSYGAGSPPCPSTLVSLSRRPVGLSSLGKASFTSHSPREPGASMPSPYGTSRRTSRSPAARVATRGRRGAARSSLPLAGALGPRSGQGRSPFPDLSST